MGFCYKKSPENRLGLGAWKIVDCVKRLQTPSDTGALGAKIKPKIGGLCQTHVCTIVTQREKTPTFLLFSHIRRKRQAEKSARNVQSGRVASP